MSRGTISVVYFCLMFLFSEFIFGCYIHLFKFSKTLILIGLVPSYIF